MTYSTILTHVDMADSQFKMLDFACQFAHTHAAHLIGMGVASELSFPAFTAGPMPGEIYAQFAEQQRETLQQLRLRFEQKAKDHGLAGRHEWRDASGDISRALCRKGRTVDLMIIRQANPEEDPPLLVEMPEHLILEAGRPILILPYIGPRASFGRRILIAWNNSREAMRAVSDALPLLRKADQVTIFCANPEDRTNAGADLTQYLGQHSIAVEADCITADGLDVGDLILNEAADRDIDLIVMGGYGHSRLRETFLGGATQHLLAHMTIPLFIAH